MERFSYKKSSSYVIDLRDKVRLLEMAKFPSDVVHVSVKGFGVEMVKMRAAGIGKHTNIKRSTQPELSNAEQNTHS